MLDATVLKGELKPALIAFWETGYDGDSGMSIEDYADAFCSIIAEKIVAHITENAVVKIAPGQTIAILPPPPVPAAYSSVLVSPAGPVTGSIVSPGLPDGSLALEGSVS